MTRNETVKILKLLRTNYPNSYRNLTKEEKAGFVEIWSAAFGNIPFELVKRAVTAIIISDTREFAPNVGQVMAKICDLIGPDRGTEAVNAWDAIHKFIMNYHQDDYLEHFHELPEPVRRFVRVPDLVQIANNTTEQNANYEKPRFMKQFESVRSGMIADAIQTGNLALIADPERVKLLGLENLMLIEERK